MLLRRILAIGGVVYFLQHMVSSEFLLTYKTALYYSCMYTFLKEKIYIMIIFVTKKYCSQPKGFSLMELMIVIAIIGIVSTIAIPNFLSYRSDSRLRGAVRELVGDMQKTRISAVKNNETWAIVFDTANNRYVICSENGADDDWTTLGDNVQEKTVRFSGYKAGITYGKGSAGTPIGGTFGDFVTYPSPNNVLTFNSTGVGNSGYVYLTNNSGGSYGVGTLTSGIVILRRWNGSAWDN